MAGALSDNLRSRVLEASVVGASAVPRRRVSVSACRARFVGSPGRRSASCRQARRDARGSRLNVYADLVFGMIDERRNITLNEMVRRLKAERSVRIGRSALSD